MHEEILPPEVFWPAFFVLWAIVLFPFWRAGNINRRHARLNRKLENK
jgi:hypothetical protein